MLLILSWNCPFHNISHYSHYCQLNKKKCAGKKIRQDYLSSKINNLEDERYEHFQKKSMINRL